MSEEFEVITLVDMPPFEDISGLSTDAKYLLDMAMAISDGEVSNELANKKPGPIVNSRWLTKASRLLRLYVTTSFPVRELRILATYIIKVYVPMYFRIKYRPSVVYGSTHLFKFIRSIQYLEDNLRKLLEEKIQNNSYFAHSENILLSMLFDDRKEQRDIGIKTILHIRDVVEDLDLGLRVYTKPKITFTCTRYTTMINLKDDTLLFEPPFTRNIPRERLEQFLQYEDPPFDDPEIPSHIQGTERHVQLLAAVSKRSIDKNRDGIMVATLASRSKTPRLESKQDFKE